MLTLYVCLVQLGIQCKGWGILKVIKYKSYHDADDNYYLVLTLMEEQGVYYVAHKTLIYPKLTKSEIKALLEKGVRYTDAHVSVFKLFDFDNLEQATVFYNRSLG